MPRKAISANPSETECGAGESQLAPAITRANKLTSKVPIAILPTLSGSEPLRACAAHSSSSSGAAMIEPVESTEPNQAAGTDPSATC